MKPKLSQNICLRCRKKHKPPWTEKDEINWLRGNINCPQSVARTYTVNTCIYKDAPTWCVYKMEHIVKRGE